MRELRRLLIGLASAATWPVYLALLAYAAKVAPWPRDLAWPSCALLLGLAGGAVRGERRADGVPQAGLGRGGLAGPGEVNRQLRRVVLTLAIAGFVLLMPEALLDGGLIAPGGRPISASALGRLLVLGFELTCWILAYRLLRTDLAAAGLALGGPGPAGLGGPASRAVAWAILAGLALVLALDAAGFRFTSRRLIFGGALSVVLAGACWGAYRLLLRADRPPRLAMEEGARTSRPRRPDRRAEAQAGGATTPAPSSGPWPGAVVILAGVLVGAWVWNVDLALFRYIGEQPLWTMADQKVDRRRRGQDGADPLRDDRGLALPEHVLHRRRLPPDDRRPGDPVRRGDALPVRGPGRRAARRALGDPPGDGADRRGPGGARASGLGFGLQEIVSNFVSGIILLLERPIRVGDLVTVGEMTGKVDRINIRATTIINGDNQSMIIPNRAFITGNLVNWTHKDKIVRVIIAIHVAHGTDADKVTDLLLAIAHEDPDVLNNPVPSAFLDSVGEPR